MTTTKIGVTRTGMIGLAYEATASATAATGTNAGSRHVYSLPAWARHGPQPTYWSEAWARKERLADWDRVTGTVYEATSMDDVIAHLHRAANATQADQD